MATAFTCRTETRTPRRHNDIPPAIATGYSQRGGRCAGPYSLATSRQSGRIGLTAKQRGGRSLCRPRGLERMIYFRLVIAVRSAESLAMPAAPHQFEPNAVAPLPGLIAVTKPGLELVVL